MILIVGSAQDSCIQSVAETAYDVGVEHRFVDLLTIDHDELLIEIGPTATSGRAQIASEVVELCDVSAVYARPLDVGRSPRAKEFIDSLTQWLDLAEALVVNRPLSMRSNASKPFQAQLIASAGFVVPDTIVTNDPDAVRAFHATYGRVIFKSTSGIRSIVRELEGEFETTLSRVRALPTQFQEYVAGVDVRVHVVGDAVFATEMTTGAIDYRYARRDGAEVTHQAIEIDDELTERCRALSKLLDLPLCGIDLRRRPDGSHVCFEVNPMPAFSYYEANAGQPIARALVDFLAGKS